MEAEDLFKAIYLSLTTNKEFIEFGNYKIVKVDLVAPESEISFHKNILFSNETSYQQYVEKVNEDFVKLYNHGYLQNPCSIVRAYVWNMDDMKNAHIKVSRNATTHL